MSSKLPALILLAATLLLTGVGCQTSLFDNQSPTARPMVPREPPPQPVQKGEPIQAVPVTE